MKAKSMHKKKKQTLGIDHSARRKMRAEQISNGTWMGRNAVHKSATDYNRQKEHLETKHFSYPPLKEWD